LKTAERAAVMAISDPRRQRTPNPPGTGSNPCASAMSFGWAWRSSPWARQAWQRRGTRPS